MTIFFCLDNNGGMMFNGRRQSRDALVTEDIIKTAENGVLNIDKYSETLFKAYPDKTKTVDNFESGFCFIENKDVSAYLHLAEKLVIYRWNRDYPSDMLFTADISTLGFTLFEKTDFKGNSHESITKEIYIK